MSFVSTAGIEEGEEGPAHILGRYLAQHDEFTIFHAGSDQLNPLPVFVVGRLQIKRLITGFIGGITHT